MMVNRVLLSEISVGDSFTTSLVLAKATARVTKTNKDYLDVDVFDGKDTLNGKYWDWSGKSIPDIGEVYVISGTMGEYNGQKQLTVKAIKRDLDTPKTEFMPQGTTSPARALELAHRLISTIVDNDLRLVLEQAFMQYKDLWLTKPGAVSVHHAYVGGTLIHSVSVASIALGMAHQVSIANRDLCVAGALVHDIGKLQGYGFDGAIPIMTQDGRLFEHAAMGMQMIKDVTRDMVVAQEKVDLLCHIIASHHGELEHGAIVTPQCVEAYIVHMADKTDAISEMIKQASDATEKVWTDKVWPLNNRPVINYKWTKSLFEPIKESSPLQ